MKEFPKNIKFKYPWRKYQKRVLDELENHLEDNHLHVIAPPGSGKTILGLEVALRLNKPTLIFAPTIAIRNQWIKRFTELFLQTDEKPSWISRDIRNPKFLTVSTYQGLFAACTGEKELLETDDEDQLIKNNQEANFSTLEVDTLTAKLKKQGIGTIIVDEAHHLKNAWWKSLDKVKNHLKPTIVGLTATPPYDVTYKEWSRYLDLNGPVDAEISVPELVVEGDLCPHQDYVLLSHPTKEETAKLIQYNNRIEKLIDELKGDSLLKDTFSSLQIFKQPEEELEWIYTNLEYYSSVLIFLNSTGIPINPIHLDIIGDSNIIIPELNHEWMEIVLKFYLFSNVDFPINNEAHKEYILNQLKRNGAIERKTITLRNVEKRRKLLTSSLSKLTSIERIVVFETNELGDSLRMVVLTDYIRKEYLVNTLENNLEINKIGVLPIFEMLRRKEGNTVQIGILTGSIVIIPTAITPTFKELCSLHGIDGISTTKLSYDASYTLIKSSKNLKNHIVHIITNLFENGQIQILIGTKSLLGEGWDAPAINSLVLASFVGSYVLSNQMRGRAIRKLSTNDFKTGNIWHLVCVDLGETNGGADIELLKRRFRAFVGVSYSREPSIENGVDRLEIPSHLATKEEVKSFNQQVFKRARNREEMRKAWIEALQNGNTLIEEIKVPFPEGEDFKKSKSLYLNRTLAYLFGFLSAGVFAFGEAILNVFVRNLKYIRKIEDFLWIVGIIGVLGLGIFGRLIIKSIRLYIKYRDISKDIKNIGIALLDTLTQLNQITTPRKKLKVITSHNEHGAVYCHLEGGSTFDKSLFIQSLTEIVGEIDNPRYLIVRKSSFFRIKNQEDFHSVPESIGRLKSMSQNFETNWRECVGRCELIFTRNINGRKILLKSRLTSLATELGENVRRINKWK